MRNFKKAVSVFAAVTMLFTMTACAGTNKDSTDSELSKTQVTAKQGTEASDANTSDELTAGSDISFSDDINAAADSVITDEESSGNSDSLLSMGNSQRVQKALKKMASGEKVNIVFLGGSITYGYLVNSNQNFAYKTVMWLRKTFGNNSINLINSGISGTPSTMGLMRVKADVLDHEPDLVFIEFAVNDAEDTDSKIMYESLVKRILDYDTAPGVVLLFTRTSSGYSCEKQQSAVGTAFSLPMISVDAAIGARLDAGTMQWSDYAQDDAHPTVDGHEMIAGFIEYYLSKVIKLTVLDADMDYSTCKALGSTYENMAFYDTGNLYASDLGGFTEAADNVAEFTNDWIWGKQAGGSLKFTLKGQNLLIMYKQSPNENMGSVQVLIDGSVVKTIDGYLSTGWNNPAAVIAYNTMDNAEHTVEIRMAEGDDEKMFTILGFATTGELIGQERIDKSSLPYQERAIISSTNCYRIEKLFERAKAGEDLTIGFIGGSITQGTGATSSQKCYAYLVYQWFVDNFPNSTFTYLNAGIGATTSEFACARVNDDLLSQKPDFVIVEFSVNDTASNFYGETYESLLRTILSADNSPAVMCLNMVQYNNGTNAQIIHDAVSEAYNVPTVSMKDSIYEEIVKKNITASDISSDMLHPNDRGHEYTAEIVTYYLSRVLDGTYTSDADSELPEAIYDLSGMTSVRHNNTNSSPELSGFAADTAKQNGITDIFKNGWTAMNEGDSIKFSGLKGKRIAIQYEKTNALGAPVAEAILDGDEANAVELDGNYPDGWGNWLYLDDVFTDLDPSEEHTLEIKIKTGADKNFYLVSVITSGSEE